eukprot:COSAG05_NODE_1343_length_5135_cov_4.082208_4_plen_87_part_00
MICASCCSGGDFDAEKWNDNHGSTCELNRKAGDLPCAPIPRNHPYDVDCSWIQNRLHTVGGTGYADAVGAEYNEQYLLRCYAEYQQ